MRRFFTTMIAVSTVLAISGCNTISGAGQDLSSVGKAVSKTANDVKD